MRDGIKKFPKRSKSTEKVGRKKLYLLITIYIYIAFIKYNKLSHYAADFKSLL